MDMLSPHIESLIFSADRPISRDEILDCLEVTFETQVDTGEIDQVLADLRERYTEGPYAFELVEIAGGYQFMTKPAYHATAHTYLRQSARKRLSAAALETLSIIAYRQPVPKSEMEAIRGVSCDYSIQKLLEKELIIISGRSETVGKPLLYSTSEKFMDYFGLKSMADLPKLKDFKGPEEEIGEAPSADEIQMEMSLDRRAVAEVLDDRDDAGNQSGDNGVSDRNEEE
ncbi:MAG: SMC-Scp complex subunit ScpB [Lewinellaceae bacterium]|nr:SMC-Scp complex subunit ScpB [Saprospiraceae bacterium]MCB9313326.1 SMC-Scp complex subunit ScpB [Lewinellaceae bacterium]